MTKETGTALLERLRLSILGGMHVGRLRPGDRLPSIRQVARETGVDHRAVARVYEQLEQERLVEVRGRSGVFIPAAESTRANLHAGRKHWLSHVLYEGWSRRLSIAESSALLARCTQHGLRALCVESTQDHMIAFSSELSSDFGFSTICEHIPDAETLEPALQAVLRERAAEADVVVTTSFHVGLITRLVGDLAPVHAVSVNPALRDQIRKRLDDDVTVVIADPRFAARIAQYAGHLPQGGRQIKTLLASDVDPATLPEESTLYTRAARRALGLGEYHLLSGNIPYIAPESAAALCDLIVERVLVDSSAS